MACPVVQNGSKSQQQNTVPCVLSIVDGNIKFHIRIEQLESVLAISPFVIRQPEAVCVRCAIFVCATLLSFECGAVLLPNESAYPRNLLQAMSVRLMLFPPSVHGASAFDMRHMMGQCFLPTGCWWLNGFLLRLLECA